MMVGSHQSSQRQSSPVGDLGACASDDHI